MNLLLVISILFNIVLLAIIIAKAMNKGMNPDNIGQNLHDNIQDKGQSTEEKSEEQTAGNLNFNDFKAFIQNADKTGISKSYETLIRKIATEFEASQAAFYLRKHKDNKNILQFAAGYAFYLPDSNPIEFEFGEGLIGQVAKDKKTLNINTVPLEHTPVFSGLGKTVPQYLVICPIIKGNETIGVMEFSSFKPFIKEHELFLEKAAELIAIQIGN